LTFADELNVASEVRHRFLSGEGNLASNKAGALLP